MNRYRVHYQVNDRDYTWEGYADNRQKILAKFERNVAAKHKSEEKLTVTQIEEQTIIRVEVTGFKDELQGAAQQIRRIVARPDVNQHCLGTQAMKIVAARLEERAQ